MISISTDLPFRYRLGDSLRKRRRSSYSNTFISSLKTISKARSGNKISRFFRHIFEHKHIRQILGSNIALFVMVSSFIPVPTENTTEPEELIVITSNEVNLKTEGHIQYPLETVKINQGYHFFHPGIDFEGQTGESVRPIMKGEVVGIQYSNFAYGNAVLIRHGDNYSSLYAHLSKIHVVEGQQVDLNTKIGEVGSSGRSSGDHLHLEIRENAHPINPLSLLPVN